MQIKEEKKGVVKIIGLCGRLDASSGPGVEEKLISILDQGETCLVCDLSELTYISSLGLRVLILLAKNVQKAKGRLALAAPSGHIYEIFKIASFTSVFSIYPTCDEAVAHLQASSCGQGEVSNPS
jgi:anti-anti-sigma factor